MMDEQRYRQSRGRIRIFLETKYILQMIISFNDHTINSNNESSHWGFFHCRSTLMCFFQIWILHFFPPPNTCLEPVVSSYRRYFTWKAGNHRWNSRQFTLPERCSYFSSLKVRSPIVHTIVKYSIDAYIVSKRIVHVSSSLKLWGLQFMFVIHVCASITAQKKL